ncbi:MAG: hypothetical protein V3S09_02875 [Candidatus Bathyarchaeia archaeon]
MAPQKPRDCSTLCLSVPPALQHSWTPSRSPLTLMLIPRSASMSSPMTLFRESRSVKTAAEVAPSPRLAMSSSTSTPSLKMLPFLLLPVLTGLYFWQMRRNSRILAPEPSRLTSFAVVVKMM